MALLEVKDLKVHFPVKAGILKRTVGLIKAVDGISFELESGKTYGLVGESGSGKTTSGRAIIGLNDITSGKVIFNGHDITLGRKAKLDFRKDIQMIFQDPYSSLNPKKRVLDIIAEPLRNFRKMTKAEEQKNVEELLEKVGLSRESLVKYPHEFSGGQRQRIGIARAIALKPKLVIADEPVSALDVSVQAQVLNFMADIQKELNLTYLFISHDLGIVRHFCDRIGIMYRGRFVEEGTREDIFENPQHIYTKRLISAIPDINPENRNKTAEMRQKVKEQYEKGITHFFTKEGKVFDLQAISKTHLVALPGKGE